MTPSADRGLFFNEAAREAAARTLASAFGYEDTFDRDLVEEVYDRDYWLDLADESHRAGVAALPLEELAEQIVNCRVLDEIADAAEVGMLENRNIYNDAARILAALGLPALPERSKAILALAALSDEELVERVAMALSARHGSEVIWTQDREAAPDVLAALGLPVAAAQEGTKR